MNAKNNNIKYALNLNIRVSFLNQDIVGISINM